MLDRFTLVAPVEGLLGNGSARDFAPSEQLLRHSLGWHNVSLRRAPTRLDPAMARMHNALEPFRRPLLEAAGEQMREHNRWDLELLDWVRQRFARDLAAAQRL